MKKILSGILSLTIMLSICLNAFAFYEPLLCEEELSPDETVCFIVEVDGDAVLETDTARKAGTSYLNTYDDTSSATEIRLFIWDNNISPLDTKKVFTIND